MNTKMMEQFSVMDNEMLDRIEGGIFGVYESMPEKSSSLVLCSCIDIVVLYCIRIYIT